jgi:hypothetical protein
MKNVWLFGDSYADKRHNKARIKSWPLLLEENYNTTNFAVAGSGPEYSLEKFYRESHNISEEDAKDITVIFFISNLTRYYLSFLQPYNQCIIRYATFENSDNRLDFNAKNNVKKFLDKSKISFIRDLFRYYHLHQDEEVMILKSIGLLRVLGSKFNKILCVSCFSPVPDIVPLNDSNFYLFSYLPLYMLGKHDFIFGGDDRSNHIENAQHNVMYDQLKNWIELDTPIDFERIKNAK